LYTGNRRLARLRDDAHGLIDELRISIRLPGVERAARTEMLKTICEAAAADAVQEIGRMAVIYRPGEKPRLKLPE